MERQASLNRHGLSIPLPQPKFISQVNSESSSPTIPQSFSQWKLFDLLKISGGSHKPLPEPEPVKEADNETTVSNCICCSTILSYPQNATKYKCSVCHTTNILQSSLTYFDAVNAPHTISYKYVHKILEKCLASINGGGTLHEVFEPLSTYLYNAFQNYHCLNSSFKLKRSSTKIHYSTSNISYEDVRMTFDVLTKLPTKRPLFSALQGCLILLKRLPTSFGDDARNYCWLLILFEIPFLSYALTHYELPKKSDKLDYHSMIDVPEVKALSYDILKRVVGILSNIQSVTVKNYIISWFSKYSQSNFTAKIDLINVYVTFHLKKYFYIANNPDYRRRNKTKASTRVDPEYVENSNFKEEIEQMNSLGSGSLPMSLSRSKSKKSKETTAKIKIYQYGNDWHLKTASIVLEMFMEAYNIRGDHLNVSVFYNSLVDYVNLKMDFDSWVSNKKFLEAKPSDTPEILTVLDYINGIQSSYSTAASYFFCKFPFLITLGNKISILEYEAKRIMERKAEEAFINSLDKRIPMDVYFRVKVRRDHIVQDSLNSIKMNQQNLRKSLKVQFLGEAGIDAGGLKKEWFLLLTKSIFNPQTGIVVNVNESNYHWFNLVPIDNLEIYYLFGAILGLAIYNSTILDLKFPMAFYKMLLDIPLGFSDFQQLYPELSKNLFKLKSLTEEELEALDLNFEISVSDIFNNVITKKLIPGGNKVRVSVENRDFYIEKYAKFHLIEGISEQIKTFLKGFNSVTSGNALAIFSPEEIELLICGNEEGKLEVDVLKSVTRYMGWSSHEEAKDSDIINWFWEYVRLLTYKEQKKFLSFVTGSDRIPATGIQNLNFTVKKITKDRNKLPVAHTCFNELDLFNYTSKEELHRKLRIAINESSGFAIK